MGRTGRKILQLDRFSLLFVPVFYVLTAGIFIAVHRTWTSEFKLWTFGDAKLYFSLCFVHIWVKYQGLNIKKTYFIFTILCHLCPGFLAECETFYGEFWQIYDQQPDANWAINVANAFARRRTEILLGEHKRWQTMLIVEVDLKWTTDPDFECWMIWRLRKQPKEPMHQNWPVFGVGMWTKQESRQIICTFVNFFFFKCWHIYHFLFPIIVPRRRLGMLEEVLMRSVSKLAKMFQQISFPGKGRSLPPPRSGKKVGKCETGSKFRNWEWQVDQG